MGYEKEGLLSEAVASALIKVHDCRKLAQANNEPNQLAALKKALTSAVSPPEGAQERLFYVQFNPSELNITISEDVKKIPSIENSMKQDMTDAKQTGKSGVKTAEETIPMPKAECSMKLIFNHVMNQDAFLADNLITAPSRIAGIDREIHHTVYTVQTEVEGLLAVLQDPFTRLITFQWGRFSFTGFLSNLSARYTMFSRSGRPVHATVDLTITQGEAADTLRQWAKDFQTAFQGDTDFQTVSQKLGTFLNLPTG